jgi:hypothetical protein
MSDIVDVLDASEARRKRELKVTLKLTNGRPPSVYVRATFTDGAVDWIEGFATEGEAATWIKNEAAVWLHKRKRS